MRISRWVAKLLAAVVFGCPLVAASQENVLVPGGPIELRVESLKPENHQNLNVLVARLDDDKVDQEDDTPGSEYWLGLQVAALPEITKRQLAIKHGLAVEDVTAESPAARAEIKRYDILLKAGDTPLKGVADLIKTVEAAEGKELEITVRRDGESRTIRVTADKRPRSETAVEIVRKKMEATHPELAGEIKQLEEALEKLKSKAGKDGFGMWFAKPAIVSPRMELKFDDKFRYETKADFPKDLSVQVNKQGGEATKIRVKRGEQEWNVTEETIGELPEDIRGHVEKMMGHMHGPHVTGTSRAIRVTPGGKIEGVLNFTPAAPAAPVAPLPPAAPKPPAAVGTPTVPAPPTKATARTIVARVDGGTDGTNAKLDAIMKKLEKLESEVESLREKK